MNPPRKPESGHDLGLRGEEVAATYLERRGLSVLERRFRTRSGEIDLVCVDTSTREEGYGGDIVFVEVKTRSTIAFGRPESSLSSEKQRRLHTTGELFLRQRGMTERQARIDVVAILFEAGVAKSIDHYRNAVGVCEIGYRNMWNDNWD